MKTWQIIDEYHVHGLAFTVDHCTRCFRRRLGVNSKTARQEMLWNRHGRDFVERRIQRCKRITQQFLKA